MPQSARAKNAIAELPLLKGQALAKAPTTERLAILSRRTELWVSGGIGSSSAGPLDIQQLS